MTIRKELKQTIVLKTKETKITERKEVENKGKDGQLEGKRDIKKRNMDEATN